MKIKFYFMSLWFLFVLIFIATVDIPLDLLKDLEYISFASLLRANWLAAVSLFLAVLGLIFVLHERYKWSGVLNHPKEIESVKSINYECFVFLSFYIVPVACIDLTDMSYVLVLAALVVAAGVVAVKMNLYDGNPTLALFGYKFYRAKIKDASHTEAMLISKDTLSDTALIQWRWIDKDNRLMLAKKFK